MEWGGGGAALGKVRRSTETALDQLKDAFWQLDSSQRFARAQVEAYVEHLSERAQRSGLQSGFRFVDDKAERGVAEYLAVIDRFAIEPGMRERRLVDAQQAFQQTAHQLRTITEELDRFVTSHSAELALVGKQLRAVEQQKLLAQDAAEAAEAQWLRLQKDGLGSLKSGATARDDVRSAILEVDIWQPDRGLADLRKRVEAVQAGAAALEKLATDCPGQVQRVRRRVPSLRTRIDAIATRRAGIASWLGDLRREFSLGNWRDLDGQEELVAAELATTRALVDRLQSSVSNESWENAFALLAEAELHLQRADCLVDAPRERLAVLREFRDNPAARLDRTRFTIKDAQVMVVKGPLRNIGDIATKLDSLALRVGRVQALLDGVHPDYWSMLTEVDGIEQQVREAVSGYRSRLG